MVNTQDLLHKEESTGEINKFEILEREWEKFIKGHSINTKQVPLPISEAWLRCKDKGIDPIKGNLNQCKNLKRSPNPAQNNVNLVEQSIPFMHNLLSIIGGNETLVLLADRDLNFVKIIAGENYLMPENFNDMKDLNFKEDFVGNNSMSMCKEFGEPIQISGAEHYCKFFHPYTCSASPIYTLEGRLLGVMNVTMKFHEAHPHTLGMVIAATHAIGTMLSLFSAQQKIILAHNFLKSAIQAHENGVLIIDETGIIKFSNLENNQNILKNTKNNNLFNQTSFYDYFNPKVINDVLTNGKTFTKIESQIFLPNNETVDCYVSLNPILEQNKKIIGAIISLWEKKQAYHFISESIGAKAKFFFKDIISISNSMQKTINLARKAAKTYANILLIGETGTGKELLAASIHNESKYQKGPFIAVNCSAIPRELIESELFGYESGAFTGAQKGGRPGKFELANGGTIFLDEIGDMPLEMQAKLLRVLQNKTISRIGGNREIKLGIRVISATNKNLASEIKSGKFRKDLFFRINVFTITIPPLRERIGDIPTLATFFLHKLNDSGQTGTNQISNKAMDLLSNYAWPGNVRELENIIERSSSICEDKTLNINHIPEELFPHKVQVDSKDKVNSNIFNILINEKELCIKALNTTGGNITKSSKLLGISRSTFYRKMKIYSIENDSFIF